MNITYHRGTIFWITIRGIEGSFYKHIPISLYKFACICVFCKRLNYFTLQLISICVLIRSVPIRLRPALNAGKIYGEQKKYFRSCDQRDQRGVSTADCWNWGELELKSTNERGPALIVSLISSYRYKRLLSCLSCSGQPSTKYVFLTVHYFILCVLIAQQPGQAVVQGHLSLNVCLWLGLQQFSNFDEHKWQNNGFWISHAL